MRKKHIVGKLFVLTALLCTVFATNSQAAKITSLYRLNVRQQANASCEVLTLMPKGVTRTVRGVSDDGKWYQIMMNGRLGYVNAAYVRYWGDNITSSSTDNITGNTVYPEDDMTAVPSAPASYYDLQTNYSGVPYTTASGRPAGATIYSGGCAPTSIGNILRNQCGIDAATTRAVCSLAISSGARTSAGTLASPLLAACKKRWGGFTYTYTGSDSVMRQFVENGGMALAHSPGSSNGSSGLFSSGGHFVSVIGAEGSRLKVCDPYYYSGKWTANSVRRNNIQTTDTVGVVLANTNAVYAACDYYYLIK